MRFFASTWSGCFSGSLCSVQHFVATYSLPLVYACDYQAFSVTMTSLLTCCVQHLSSKLYTIVCFHLDLDSLGSIFSIFSRVSTYLVHSSGSHLVYQHNKRGISLILSPFAESYLIGQAVSHDVMWWHDPIYHNQRWTIRIILSLAQHTEPDLLHDISHIHLRLLYQVVMNMCNL